VAKGQIVKQRAAWKAELQNRITWRAECAYVREIDGVD
jgi:hypothetical protein